MDSQVFYSEGLIQSLERSMREAYSSPNIRLGRKPAKTVGRFSVEIVSEGREFLSRDAESAQRLFEVGGAIPKQLFWGALRARFELWRGGRHFLEHIALSMFQQVPDGGLIRMFRADWDGVAARDSSSGHAQPHWHFAMEEDDFRTIMGMGKHSSPSSKVIRSFVPEDDVTFGVTGLSGFHFAMASLWRRGVPTCHRETFQSEDELRAWFLNLSVYVAQQLAYVSKKSGAMTTVVRDFVPGEAD